MIASHSHDSLSGGIESRMVQHGDEFFARPDHAEQIVVVVVVV